MSFLRILSFVSSDIINTICKMVGLRSKNKYGDISEQDGT